jgi:PKD repeat protein
MLRSLSLVALSGFLAAQVCGTARLQPNPPKAFQVRPFHRLSQDSCQRPIYTIPIVFHIIHSGGADSLPASVIENQMQRLFEDFLALPQTLGYTPWGANTGISFELATKDPQGNATTGIIYWRYNQPPLSWSRPGLCITDEYAMKQSTGWPRDRYLNVWVVPAICGFFGDCNDCSGIAGYAYYPDIGDPILYGSVVGTAFIGGRLTGRGGRTLVHELGHNLALAHPFDGGCGNTDCLNSGDLVCDTPPTAQENFGLRRQNTCTTDTPDRPDNPTNYMDYVADASMTHFTPGQVERAQAFIEDPLSRLYPLADVSNHPLTGVGPYGPVRVYFWSPARRVLTNTPVRFYSQAQGAPTIYTWDFAGGQSPNPTDPCPIATFSAPGQYSITLIAENAAGYKDTLTRVSYITVEDSVWPLPYQVDFEGSFPPAGVMIENPDGRRTWERWAGWRGAPGGAFGASAQSARLPAFTYGFYGEKDYLLTPALNFQVDSTEDIRLSFAYWYAPLDWGSSASSPLLYTDTLRIWASRDGGGSWELVYEKGGLDLSSSPTGAVVVRGSLSSSVSLPDSASWKRDTIRLSTFKGIKGVRLRIEGQTGWGNNLYLDDIVVERYTPRPDTTDTLQSLSLSRGGWLKAYLHGATLRVFSSEPQMVQVEVYEGQGRLIERRQVWVDVGGVSERLLLEKAGGLYVVVVRPQRTGSLVVLRGIGE